MVPRKKIKTQSVKQKCFESITQSIRHLRKPKIKSYPIQKRKTDKPNVIITIVYPALPLLCVSRGESQPHRLASLQQPHKVCDLKITKSQRSDPVPRPQAREQADWIWTCPFAMQSLEHMASNPGRWEVGHSRTSCGTKAPKTRWPAWIPLATCSPCSRDDEDTCWRRPFLRAGRDRQGRVPTAPGRVRLRGQRKNSEGRRPKTSRKPNCTPFWGQQEDETK